MIDRSYHSDAEFDEFDSRRHKKQWERFEHQVFRLNEGCEGKGCIYRVLYLGRHGEGFHNVAEEFYGTDAWDVCLASQLS